MTGNRVHAFILALVVAASATAADTPKPDPKEPEKSSSTADQPIDRARAAIARQDWAAARDLLRVAVARNPQSADAHNLYAFSMRKGPDPEMDLVFRHYNEALRIDPQHRGAHEYIGEAYLMTGNVAKAKEHLAQLDRLCSAGCREQAMLKKEITTFEHQHASK